MFPTQAVQAVINGTWMGDYFFELGWVILIDGAASLHYYQGSDEDEEGRVFSYRLE
jgi:hypothetical protein